MMCWIGKEKLTIFFGKLSSFFLAIERDKKERGKGEGVLFLALIRYKISLESFLSIVIVVKSV